MDDPIEADSVFESQQWLAASKVRELDEKIRSYKKFLTVLEAHRSKWKAIEEHMRDAHQCMQHLSSETAGPHILPVPRSPSDLEPTQ